MIDQRLLEYIKQKIDSGSSKENIKSELMEAGWQESDIEEGLKEVQQVIPPEPMPSNISRSSNFPAKTILIASAILLMLLLIGVGAYFYLTKSGLPIISPESENSNADTEFVENTPANSDNLPKTDCGISTLLSANKNLDDYFKFDFESDVTYVCLGRNIINGCINSQGIIINNGRQDVVKVEGGASDCRINLINPAGFNLACPVNRLIEVDVQGKTSDGTLISEKPGTYFATLSFVAAFNAFASDSQQYCSGTLLNEMKK